MVIHKRELPYSWGCEEGILIKPLLKVDLEEWLSGACEKIQSWVKGQEAQFHKNGYILLPDHQTGKIDHIIWIQDALYDNPLLAWADLAQKLPPHRYKFLDSFHIPFLGALGWGLTSYKYQPHKITSNQNEQPILILPDHIDRKKLEAHLESIFMVRDLINMTAEELNPATFPNLIEKIIKPFNGVSGYKKISGKTLQKEYPAIHMVGKGGRDEPCLVHFRWRPKTAGKTPLKTVALVGKGVTFDTGGLNIKPDKAMLFMKKDMGGAACILGLAHLIMSMELPVELQIYLPIVENSVSDRAMRPLDITMTRSGKTIEIGHTDAEGRVILADALYAACEGNPDLIIDCATLTGAARVALGTDLPGLFSNNSQIAQEIVKIGQDSMDPLWHMPLYQPYFKELATPRADINNSPSGAYGGAITAALFLEYFINSYHEKMNKPVVPWVHVDMMAYNLKSTPGKPEGGEAMAIRALYEFLKVFVS